jgi:hypothetical protein
VGSTRAAILTGFVHFSVDQHAVGVKAPGHQRRELAFHDLWHRRPVRL